MDAIRKIYQAALILVHIVLSVSQNETPVYIFSPKEELALAPNQNLVLVWANDLNQANIKICIWEHAQNNDENSWHKLLTYDALVEEVTLNLTGYFEFINPKQPCTSGIWSSADPANLPGFYRMSIYEHDNTNYLSPTTHVTQYIPKQDYICKNESKPDASSQLQDSTGWIVGFVIVLLIAVVESIIILIGRKQIESVLKRKRRKNESKPADRLLPSGEGPSSGTQARQDTREQTPKSVPRWCDCGNCQDYRTDEEKCCGQSKNKCIAKSKKFQDMVVEYHIRESDENDFKRKKLFRECSTFLQHGRELKPFPSCCLWEIRRKYPDREGDYSGFKHLKKCNTCGHIKGKN